ncbi:MAG: hypothetical protein JWQ14_2623 [Adhaeribacter sp.]|nr:hypothetical protein [Adhaeribacter sp.]
MIRLKNVDFTKYSPVQLRRNNSYYIYTVDKHVLFDEAGEEYAFFCHPLTPYGEADYNKSVTLTKRSIKSVPILL